MIFRGEGGWCHSEEIKKKSGNVKENGRKKNGKMVNKKGKIYAKEGK
jgi:hypothetical protein